MQKLIRNGKVAVLYSVGFGAGWSTWAHDDNAEALLFDRDIAKAVLAGDTDKAAKIAEAKYPGGYWGGSDELVVGWVPKGARFTINEYDGAESLHIYSSKDGYVA